MMSNFLQIDHMDMDFPTPNGPFNGELTTT